MNQPNQQEVWILVLIWFLISAIASTYLNSAFLAEFHGSSFSHTWIRFLGSSFLGLLSKKVTPRVNKETFGACILPAFCLLIANLFNSISLDYGGITLTYVVKAGIPVLTALLCTFFLKEVFPPKSLLSLFPIVLGVSLAAISDDHFSWVGFLASCASTSGQAVLNVSSKRALLMTKLSPAQFQFNLVLLGSMLLFVGSVMMRSSPASDFLNLLPTPMDGLKTRFQFGLIFSVALSYHVEHVLNFMITPHFSALAFSVLDVLRRMCIIVSGAFLFQKRLSLLNGLGVLLAMGGVLFFFWVSSSSHHNTGDENHTTTKEEKKEKQEVV